MSTSGTKGEREKTSQKKFQSLTITFPKNKSNEGESNQQKVAGSLKHGFQKLGKVPAARRPANLPSLKAEGTVQTVPGSNTDSNSNSTTSQNAQPGWQTTKENNPIQTKSQTVDGMRIAAKDGKSQVPPHVSSHQFPPGRPSHTFYADGKSWALKTHGDTPPSFLEPHSPHFQQEFPSLSNDSNGPGGGPGARLGLSLRPQTEGSWIQGGSRIEAQPAGNHYSTGLALGHPLAPYSGVDGALNSLSSSGAAGAMTDYYGVPQAQHALPPQYHNMLPSFMRTYPAGTPSTNTSTQPGSIQNHLFPDYPPPETSNNNLPCGKSIKEESSVQILRKPDITNQVIEEKGRSDLWPMRNQYDFNRKPIRTSESEKSLKFDDPLPFNKLDLKDAPIRKTSSGGGGVLTDEEIALEKQRAKLEKISLIARQRKDEEENRFMKTKEAAAEKLKKLEEKMGCKPKEAPSTKTVQVKTTNIPLPEWERNENSAHTSTSNASTSYENNFLWPGSSPVLSNRSRDDHSHSTWYDERNHTESSQQTSKSECYLESRFPNRDAEPKGENSCSRSPAFTVQQRFDYEKGQKPNTPENERFSEAFRRQSNRRDSERNVKNADAHNEWDPRSASDRSIENEFRSVPDRSFEPIKQSQNEASTSSAANTRSNHSDDSILDTWERDNRDGEHAITSNEAFNNYDVYREQLRNRQREHENVFAIEKEASKYPYEEKRNIEQEKRSFYNDSDLERSKSNRPAEDSREKGFTVLRLGGRGTPTHQKELQQAAATRQRELPDAYTQRKSRNSREENRRDDFSTLEEPSFSWLDDNEMERLSNYAAFSEESKSFYGVKNKRRVPGPITREKLAASEEKAKKLTPLRSSEIIDESENVKKVASGDHETDDDKTKNEKTATKPPAKNADKATPSSSKTTNEKPKENMKPAPLPKRSGWEKNPLNNKKSEPIPPPVNDTPTTSPSAGPPSLLDIVTSIPPEHELLLSLRDANRRSKYGSGIVDMKKRIAKRTRSEVLDKRQTWTSGGYPIYARIPLKGGDFRAKKSLSKGALRRDRHRDGDHDGAGMGPDGDGPSFRKSHARRSNSHSTGDKQCHDEEEDENEDYGEKQYYSYDGSKRSTNREHALYKTTSNRAEYARQNQSKRRDGKNDGFRDGESSGKINRAIGSRKPALRHPIGQRTQQQVRSAPSSGDRVRKDSGETHSASTVSAIPTNASTPDPAEENWETASEGDDSEEKCGIAVVEKANVQTLPKPLVASVSYPVNKKTPTRLSYQRSTSKRRNRREDVDDRKYRGEDKYGSDRPKMPFGRINRNQCTSEDDQTKNVEDKWKVDERSKGPLRHKSLYIPSNNRIKKKDIDDVIKPIVAKENWNKPVPAAKDKGVMIPAPLPPTNAWDKPITEVLKSKNIVPPPPLVTVPVTAPPMPKITIKKEELFKVAVKIDSPTPPTPRESVKLTAELVATSSILEKYEKISTTRVPKVDPALLDGSSAPTQTMIFENAKFKRSGNGIISIQSQMSTLKIDGNKDKYSLSPAGSSICSLSPRLDVGVPSLGFSSGNALSSSMLDFAFSSDGYAGFADENSDVDMTAAAMHIVQQSSSSTEDLKYRLDSVKKVWENDGNAIESLNATDNSLNSTVGAATFTPSYTRDTTDASSCYVKGHVDPTSGLYQVEEVLINPNRGQLIYSNAVQNDHDFGVSSQGNVILSNSSNSNLKGSENHASMNDSQSSMTQLMNRPSSMSSPYSFGESANQSNSAFTPMSFQSQFGNAQPILSPPMFNSNQEVPTQQNAFYQPFPLDNSQTQLNNTPSGVRSQYSSNNTFSPAAAAFSQPSLYQSQSSAMQPSSDIYSSNFRMQQQAQPSQQNVYGGNQQALNSLMSNTPGITQPAKTVSQQITAIGTKAGNANFSSQHPPPSQMYLPNFGSNQMLETNFSNAMISQAQQRGMPNSATHQSMAPSYYSPHTNQTPGQANFFPNPNPNVQPTGSYGMPPFPQPPNVHNFPSPLQQQQPPYRSQLPPYIKGGGSLQEMMNGPGLGGPPGPNAPGSANNGQQQQELFNPLSFSSIQKPRHSMGKSMPTPHPAMSSWSYQQQANMRNAALNNFLPIQAQQQRPVNNLYQNGNRHPRLRNQSSVSSTSSNTFSSSSTSSPTYSVCIGDNNTLDSELKNEVDNQEKKDANGVENVNMEAVTKSENAT